MGVLEVNLAC
jgi:hypothetical protein